MLGIVLWSDSSARKAVIWCEDQGDLAYYTGVNDTEIGHVLDEGDLVRFDLREDDKMRYASNPRIVQSQGAPDLPDQLRSRAPADSGRENPTEDAGAQIIDLNSMRRHEDSRSARARSGSGKALSVSLT